jgi:hypothetical protein
MIKLFKPCLIKDVVFFIYQKGKSKLSSILSSNLEGILKTYNIAGVVVSMQKKRCTLKHFI